MLRTLVVLVLLLNLLLAGAIWAVHTGYWVWPDAWRGESHEPERLTRQLKPEALVLKPAASASQPASAPAATVSSASAPPVSIAAPAIKVLCLQSAGNAPEVATKFNAALKESLPGVKSETLASREGGLWMVYMGKYADINAATKKLDEVKRLKIPGDFALIRNTEALRPGISLGTFRGEEYAQARLEEVGKKGVKTARVVVVNPPKELSTIKLLELDITLRERADELVRKTGAGRLEECPKA